MKGLCTGVEGFTGSRVSDTYSVQLEHLQFPDHLELRSQLLERMRAQQAGNDPLNQETPRDGSQAIGTGRW